MKSDFFGCFDNLEKEDMSGHCEWIRGPVVTLRLRNAADYRLPTFGSHGTRLGHS